MKVALALAAVLVALLASAFAANAKTNNHYVFCGNFSGQGMSPHVARRPSRCDVTRRNAVIRLRSMNWSRFGKRAVGRGLVNGRMQKVRFKQPRPCGQNGEYKVYSRMAVGYHHSHPILYCGD